MAFQRLVDAFYFTLLRTPIPVFRTWNMTLTHHSSSLHALLNGLAINATLIKMLLLDHHLKSVLP
jgi:hypothetical protein